MLFCFLSFCVAVMVSYKCIWNVGEYMPSNEKDEVPDTFSKVLWVQESKGRPEG